MKRFVLASLLLAGTFGAAYGGPVIDITIDISEQEMFVQSPDGSAVWDISSGRSGYDTPTGEFVPQRMDPMHFSKKYDNAPMPNSIFFKDGYAIHGTNDVGNLGRPVSHGCIRLHPQSAALLYRTIEYYGMGNTVIHVVP